MSTHHSHGPRPDRGPAPVYPNHDSSPAAILSRAHAYAAERAAELAARPPLADPRPPAEILAAIEAELASAEPVRPAPIGDGAEILADMARALDGGRP